MQQKPSSRQGDTKAINMRLLPRLHCAVSLVDRNEPTAIQITLGRFPRQGNAYYRLKKWVLNDINSARFVYKIKYDEALRYNSCQSANGTPPDHPSCMDLAFRSTYRYAFLYPINENNDPCYLVQDDGRTPRCQSVCRCRFLGSISDDQTNILDVHSKRMVCLSRRGHKVWTVI